MNRTPSLEGRAILPILLLTLLAGCAPYRTFDLPSEPAHAQGAAEEANGVMAAAQLIVDPRGVEHYFGPEFRDGGYFAVVVSLENRGTGSFEFERAGFGLVLENGERFEPFSPRDILEDVRRPALRWHSILLAPLVVPLILAHRDAADYNFDMARALQARSFPRVLRLEPTDPPFAKALYFRDPSGRPRTEAEFMSAVLQFVAEIEGSPPGDGLPGGEVRVPDSLRVGKLVTFTLSLSRREI